METRLEKMRDAMENLETLRKKRDETFRALERSVAMLTLWPTLFAAGRATSWIQGVTLHVKSGAGEVRTFPLSDVPEILGRKP